MHMFNVSTLSRQSIKLMHQKLWKELIGPSGTVYAFKKPLRITMGNNSHKIGPTSNFSAISICYVDMNVYARLYKISFMTLQDIKETLSMHKKKPLRITKGNNSHRIDP